MQNNSQNLSLKVAKDIKFFTRYLCTDDTKTFIGSLPNLQLDLNIINTNIITIQAALISAHY